MKHSYIELIETFDADKLQYIVDNFDTLKEQMRPITDPDYDPLNIITKYLKKSRHGVVKTTYRQNNSEGRYCAVGSLSLQQITREIRHTIAKDFYVDIDVANCHPVIFLFLCKKYKFDCEYLELYIKDREKYLKDLGVDRETGKQVYLALTNGGSKDYNELPKKTLHLQNYRLEMINLHSQFAKLFADKFEAFKKRADKDYNLEASFMNTLLCDWENKILMAMYEYFGKPTDAVLCYDGIMLRKGEDASQYDLQGCQEFVKERIGINIKLEQKPFKNAMTLPEKIKKMEYERLEYFTDFKHFVGQEVHLEVIEEWRKKCLILIENNGRPYFLVKSLKQHRLDCSRLENIIKWEKRHIEEVCKGLQISCDVINPYYDYDFTKNYHSMTPKERKLLNISKRELKKMISKYIFESLGVSIRKADGYMTHLLEHRKIESYVDVEFYPYFKEKPPPSDNFNMFTGFPLQYSEEDAGDWVFENSMIYKHMNNDFFRNNEKESNHFHDFVADTIQDPARIKGVSHIFYSKQGCGKGVMYYFLSKLLGTDNTLEITNAEKYFTSSFNVENGNKLLKVFEELGDKGAAHKHHNRMKAEITNPTERIEPKGIDATTFRNCARIIMFSNYEDNNFIPPDCRRHTLHHCSDEHQDDKIYFAKMIKEIEDPKFMKCAFNWYSTRKYEEQNVRTAFITDYKKQQKLINLPHGIKFILELVEKKFKKIEDKDVVYTTQTMIAEYNMYCTENGTRYNKTSLYTQLRKINLEPKQHRITKKDGTKSRKYCFIINTSRLQEDMRRYFNDKNYNLKVDDFIDE
jgi:hypothetical protein